MSSPSQAQFDNLLNFRDVGNNVNLLTSARSIKEGILFRSARPDESTQADRTLLTSKYQIKTIIDLRSQTEHINAAKKHSDAARLAQSAAVPLSNNAIATALKISGVRYAEINLNGKGFERALLKKLSWSSVAKLVSLMALGYRNEGISILGREVMQPRGLIGLGMDTLDYSGKEIKEVFEVLGDEKAYPVLVHCTQGKDRTGLIVLLVLLLCGVDVEAITKDYVRSESELEPEKEERLKEIADIGLDESFAGCPPDFVDSVMQHIERKYGGTKAYLKKVGVNEDMQRRIEVVLHQQC